MLYFMRSIIVFFLFFSFSSFAQTLYLVGDSTMANKKPSVYPETGWGQTLPEFAKKTIAIENHAVNGRSSKSFIDEGRWDKVNKSLKKGDYLVIQFGHNDQKSKDPTRYTRPNVEYKQNLTRFINAAYEKGATPILATSICRRKFSDNGILKDTHGEYLSAVRTLAKEKNVTLIDMERLTADLITNYGVEPSKHLFLHAAPGEWKNHPKGKDDDTHLSEDGAKIVARLFITGLLATNSPLADFFSTKPNSQIKQ